MSQNQINSVEENRAMMIVEVAYALPEKQKIITVNVPVGCTLLEAVKCSKIVDYFPQIDLDNDKMGLFGKAASKDQVLKANDRVEIYRPLLIDPKEVRKKRAEKAKQTKID